MVHIRIYILWYVNITKKKQKEKVTNENCWCSNKLYISFTLSNWKHFMAKEKKNNNKTSEFYCLCYIRPFFLCLLFQSLQLFGLLYLVLYAVLYLTYIRLTAFLYICVWIVFNQNALNNILMKIGLLFYMCVVPNCFVWLFYLLSLDAIWLLLKKINKLISYIYII